MLMKVLNVAEKPSVAKEISRVLSKGSYQNIQSDSKYNPVHTFPYQIQNRSCQMLFTSVTGHIMGLEFPIQYKNWKQTDPTILLSPSEAQVLKKVTPDKTQVAKNITKHSSGAQILILWLDCDREGENIAFEVVEVAQQGNRNMNILRATFSSMEYSQLIRAINNLGPPDQNKSFAVDARQEIDLRIGAAFTRFQTLNLQNKFAETKNLISYGPCQFPTLGFVVDRFREIRDFQSQPFWLINLLLQWQDGQNQTQITKFTWQRQKLYDQEIASQLYALSCLNEQGNLEIKAKVTKLEKYPKQKWRPEPLSTIAFQKLGTSKLRVSAATLMDVAEKLYQKGFISYPRTETDQYPNSMNDQILKTLISHQIPSTDWGVYASHLVNTDGKYQYPRKGKNNDNAHPPIHPTKLLTRDMAENDLQFKVYELVTRHYLACCSKNALGDETNIEVNVNEEKFSTKALMIKEYNYLEVYPYDKWNASTAPNLQMGQEFVPSVYRLEESKTQPPSLLTEKDLLGLMDKHGIGTDATYHEHIKTIQDREYATKENMYFRPSTLGVALVETYENMNHPLGKPDLRAWMEEKMGGIAQGNLQKDEVVNDVLSVMKDIFVDIKEKKSQFIEVVGQNLTETSYNNNNSNEELEKGEQKGTCGQCNSPMYVYKGGNSRKLVCEQCETQYMIPKTGEIGVLNDKCPLCNFNILQFQNTLNNQQYTICPSCYSKPPLNYEIEGNLMPCYKCKNSDCGYASGFLDNTISKCNSCQRGDMKVKKIPGEKFVFGCNQYPKCKYSSFLPSEIEKVVPTQQDCPQCMRKNKKTKLVKLKFKANASLPPMINIRQQEEGDQALYCIQPNCDPSLQEMGYKEYQVQTNTNNNFNRQNNHNRQNNNAPSSNFNNQNNNLQQRANSYDANGQKFNQYNNNNQQNNSKFTCFKCKQPGHIAPNCPNSATQNNNNSSNNNNNNNFNNNQPKSGTCYKCGQEGHWANNCPNQGQQQQQQNQPKKNYTKKAASTDNGNQPKKQGCQVCGKLRHPKGDNCPGKRVYTKRQK